MINVQVKCREEKTLVEQKTHGSKGEKRKQRLKRCLSVSAMGTLPRHFYALFSVIGDAHEAAEERKGALLYGLDTDLGVWSHVPSRGRNVCTAGRVTLRQPALTATVSRNVLQSHFRLRMVLNSTQLIASGARIDLRAA